MSVGGEVQLCTPKAWVFQPILPNLTFAFVTAFTSCTPPHNLRPFRAVATNRCRDAVFKAFPSWWRPSAVEPQRNETCYPPHDNQLNDFVSCIRHTTCVGRCSREVSLQGAHTRLPRDPSCGDHAMPLVELWHCLAPPPCEALTLTSPCLPLAELSHCRRSRLTRRASRA